jgi:hypothetical protein
MNTSPKTYVLSIATSDYKYPSLLPTAVRNVENIIEVLERDYEIEEVFKIHNKDIKDVDKAFSKLGEKITDEDALLILYSGHGDLGKYGATYWQFKNSSPQQDSTWYKCSRLFDSISELSVKDVLVIVDACFSGDLVIEQSISADYDKNKGAARILWTSGISGEKVEENSDFMPSITDGLKECKTEPKLSLSLLNAHVEKKVVFLPSPRHFKGHSGGNFMFHSKNREELEWKETSENDTVERYEQFLVDFENSKYAEEAENRKIFLVKENENWNKVLVKISSELNEFKERGEISNHISNIIKRVENEINKVKDETRKKGDDYSDFRSVKEECDSLSLTNDEKLERLENFITENPNSDFLHRVESLIKEFKIKIDADIEWGKIEKISKGERDIEKRKNALSAFLREYRKSEHFDKASNKYDETKIVLEAINKIDKNNFKGALELLNTCKIEYSDGDYSKLVKKKINEIDTTKRVKRYEDDLKNAKEGSSISKIKEIMDEINGLTDEEKNDEGIAKVLAEATSILEDYKKKINEDFEKILESNKIAAFRIFIDEYRNDELAKDLVEKVKRKSYDKDFELFDIAKESKEIDSFEEYVRELGEEGSYYEEAIRRIEELKFFDSITNKLGYEQYKKDYSFGLMLVEAQKKINEFDDEEELFNLIEQTEGLEKLNNCKTYLQLFADKYRFEEVKKIKTQVDDDLNNDDSAYQKAKEKRTKESFSEYLNQYPKGLNKEKAEDGLFFLECLKTDDIDKLESYIERSIVKEFEQEAKNAINRINRKNKADYAFQRIRNFNGDFEEGIRLCQVYIREYEHENEENTKLVNNKQFEFKSLKSEVEDLQKTKQESSETAYLAYLTKYGAKGIGYEEITKLLFEKQAGITGKDHQVLDVIANMATETQKSGSETVNAVKDLAVEMKKSIEQNHQVFDAVIKEIATETQKASGETVNAVNNLAAEMKKSTEQNHQIFDAVVKEIAIKTQKSGSETVNAVNNLAAEIKNSTEKDHQVFDAVRGIATETQKSGSETVNAVKDLAVEMKKSNENIENFAAILSKQEERIGTSETVTQEIRKEIKTTRIIIIIIIAVLVLVLLAILFFAFS